MFLTLDKFKSRTNELGQRRYLGHQSISPFVSMEGKLDQNENYHEFPEKIEGELFGKNDFFVGRDRYLWLDKEVQLPQNPEGMELVGVFDFGETGSGYNSGFEALLYVDGKPFQGVDTNHKEVLLGEMAGRKIRLTFLLWTGLEGGGEHRTFYHQCKQADLAYLHKKTDELYYFAKAITETLVLLKDTEAVYHDLKAALDRTFACINWDTDVFYNSVEYAHNVLMQELGKIEKRTEVTAHVVGHTHIDMAWLWRLKHTREKAMRSFSTALRLMERYDEYIFLQTQPQLYKYIKSDCPELYTKITERILEGRWEIDGGMWVEADCNISSGESLVRQFLFGTNYIKKEFGKTCNYLWLPDVFGYSWALPQILKQCGIDTFMTTKISWNQFNSIPDDLFWWRGIDGTEILTYFVDTPSEGQDSSERYSTYNGMLTPHSVLGSWKKFKNKELSKDYLISYGYGDGGGGVTRDMLELRRAMERIPGLPNVKTARAGDFFAMLHEQVEKSDRYVHTWDGELYLEYHRGTYTSQAYNKKTNRKMELELAKIEWLSVLNLVHGGKYAQKELNDSWECVLLHQFHDIIPGSSIHEVYQDSRVNYAKAYEKMRKVKAEVLAELMRPQADWYSVYTSNSFAGSELVTIQEYRNGYFTDETGKRLQAQKSENGYEVLVQMVPLGVKELHFTESINADMDRTEENVFKIKGNTLETPYYILTWNAEGQLVQIYDKKAERQVLRKGQKGNILEIYEDKPVDYDAWDIDIFYMQKVEIAEGTGSPQIVEIGPLKMALRFVYKYHKSEIVQDMIVYAESARIDFKTHVNWQESHRLLKAAFYTDIRSVKAAYDVQFGYVERPTHWNNSWDWARFEVCGHKWADLSEEGYGVSLLNESKYGYNIKDNVIKLSLLKSAKFPDTQADMGEHDFTYSLYPHKGTLTEGGVIEEANQLNLPADVKVGLFMDTRRIIKMDNDGVQIDAVKKAENEDSVIVRFHECRGGYRKVTLSSEYDVKRIISCNLLEQENEEVFEDNCAQLTLRPFEIRTVKLCF